jgi:outer membrane protein OmpA-like peptidoglycan-associated protein
MQLQKWLSTGASLGFLLLAPQFLGAQGALAAAQPAAATLPKDCADAGLKTQADCDALHAVNATKKGKGKAPADAAQVAPATPVAPANAAVDTSQAAKVLLSKDCIAAGLKTQADCDALHAVDAAKKGKGKAPADAAQVAPASPIAPAKLKPVISTDTTAPANATVDTTQAAKVLLSKDCIAAGLKTQADCDALHAIDAAKKGKGKTPADAAQVTPTTPLAPAKPGEVQLGQPAVTVPVLPDIAEGLGNAAKSFNGAAAALSKAGQDEVAADKARADLKNAQAKIDELCKANKFNTTAQCLAQYKIQLAQIPASSNVAAPGPVQPLEVISALPKGVTPDQVAPLLDSVKAKKPGKGPIPAPQGQVVAATPIAPPPVNDKSAQADIKLAKVVPIDQMKGQQIDPAANVQVQLPQNVTIVNQTVVNNTTNNTTIVTDNAQNNKRNDHPGDGAPSDGIHPRNAIGLSFGLILQLGDQLIINSPGRDQYRIADSDRDRTDYEQLPQDRYRETITRPDGVRIVTVYNRNGDVLRRSRFDRDGRETVLAYFDDSRDQDLLRWRDPGDDLPPLRLSISAQDYVLDAGQANEGQVQQFFSQPPVEQVQRLYSISEVKRSARIRDMVRRLEIGDLTFDTGSATLSTDQVPALSNVANAMLQLLQQNPAETFLIEGHTDAVGSDIANLQLSDARAAAVAQILTDAYHIPPENLATQGYGAQFLKVATAGPERLNRRVTIRRITPLVTVANSSG